MKTIHILTTAALALSLVACQHEEEVTGVDVSNTPIVFTTHVNNLTTSRAGYESGALTEGTFGLILTTAGTDADTRFNADNVEFSYTAGAWKASTGEMLLWKDNKTAVSYIAYMPYDAELGSDPRTGIIVNAVQTAETIKTDDVLYVAGTTTGAQSGTGIALAFDHKMSKLTINLTKGTELGTTTTLTGVELTSCCDLETNINLGDGTVKAVESEDQQKSTIKTFAVTAEKTYECILAPQTIDALKITVVGTTDDGRKQYVYTAATPTVFESGKAYSLALTVGRDRVEAGAITSTPWDQTSGGELVTE